MALSESNTRFMIGIDGQPPANSENRRLIGSRVVGVVGGVAAILLSAGKLHGQSTKWDSIISNSSWYVPEENLLSYITTGTSFTDPAPTVAWDQTLWSLGDCINGVFSGDSRATFYVSPEVSFTSTNTILGVATSTDQIRMQFTSSTGGTTIGIGQFRDVNGTTAMQMQMITGASGSVLFSHWAYMLPYDSNTFTPPDPLPNPILVSTEWAWTASTTWTFQNDDLFGAGGTGSFTITNYRNGYFWGSGSGPAGTLGESFTQLGSITPEGNVLFNLYDSSASLVSLTGQITGGPGDGEMILRSYGFDGTTASFGSPGFAAVVPEPGALALLSYAAGVACAGWLLASTKGRSTALPLGIQARRSGAPPESSVATSSATG
jgi:hypothetical protein